MSDIKIRQQDGRLRSRILLGAGAFIIIIIFLSIFIAGRDVVEYTRVGLVITGNADEAGWNGMQYRSVESACNKLGAKLYVKENVSEFNGEARAAVKELIAEGVDMILLTSYNYSKEVYDLVNEHRDIAFYSNSSEYQTDNMTSYFVRLYQARYLAGIAAGMKTQTNNIGYVAAMSNSEVNRGISAFTLGVQRVKPEATVHVAWTGSWDDRETEMVNARALIAECDVDVLAYHQNQTNVIEVAEEEGIYSIGYHQKYDNASDKCLAVTVCYWEEIYEELIKQYIQGRANSIKNYWIGLEKDAVGLENYSAEVTEEIRAEIDKAVNEMISGKDVFAGQIYDTNDVVRCVDGAAISDEILLESFDWLVKGVSVYEKANK